MGNVCCRIFKEQLDLINQLPKKERAIVLYNVINDVFNQFDNQNENQNENAYVSVSVLSTLGKSIYNILFKNITCKEFSNNYGGKRENAGARKKVISTPVKQNTHPTQEQVLEYAAQQNDMAGVGGFVCTPEQAQDFYDYYTGIGWVLPNDAKTPIVDWKPFLRKWVRNPRFKNKDNETPDINDLDNFKI